ncbi:MULTISPECIES: hypothetical protein [Roseomonadaceae]|uniref:Uncharacterized protein n=1 Tax=Falsiroseomonas oleicola TaxID=2801474 RepID=A0ABS6HAQ5_9PROT|nr:hypothetical protein [Roseomonas oleicola]MBU8545791.1 hypothetical protein [Roseomonas oleicola]
MDMDDRARQQIEAARVRLAHLHVLDLQTEQAERRILAAAQERLKVVEAEISRLRPRVDLDDAGDQYQAMVLERGQLHIVIAEAQQQLNGA